MAARLLTTPPARLAPQDLADPALIEILLSDSHCSEDRARAIRLLGLDPARPIEVVAVATTDGQDAAAAAVALVGSSRVGPVRVASISALAAVILPARPDGSGTIGERLVHPCATNTVAGVGAAVLPHHARQSWIQGRLALRFAVAGTVSSIVDYGELGALALLADIPSERLTANPDVQALALHTGTDAGRVDVEVLEALCRTGSLRQAATVLHMHHSSVASRIARLERIFGWDLGTPAGTLRASIALQALRFLDSPAENEAPTGV